MLNPINPVSKPNVDLFLGSSISISCIFIRSDYSPRSGANSYKAGNDDVFSLFHAETY